MKGSCALAHIIDCVFIIALRSAVTLYSKPLPQNPEEQDLPPLLTPGVHPAYFSRSASRAWTQPSAPRRAVINHGL
jgi:hypothetical protein